MDRRHPIEGEVGHRAPDARVALAARAPIVGRLNVSVL